MDAILGIDTVLLKNEANKALDAAKLLYKLKPEILKKQAKFDNAKLPNLQKRYGENFDTYRKSHRITFEIISKVTSDNWECNRCQINRRQFSREENELSEKILRLDEELRKVMQTNEYLKKRLSRVNDEYDNKLQSFEAEITKERKTNEGLKKRANQEYDKMKSFEAESTKVRKTNEDLEKRLLASSPYNKDLEDINDSCRPTQIAQTFWELYGNEWFDAFEELAPTLGMEDETTQQLLKMLTIVYEECICLSKQNFYQDVQTSIEQSNVPCMEVLLSDSLQYQIKEFRRYRANHVAPQIQQVLLRKIKGMHVEMKQMMSQSVKLTDYVKKCIEICWLMVVQDPPMVITTTVEPSEFVHDKFTHYTQRGLFIKFLVWPPVHLYEGGEVLRKGVAQGCDQLSQYIGETLASSSEA